MKRCAYICALGLFVTTACDKSEPVELGNEEIVVETETEAETEESEEILYEEDAGADGGEFQTGGFRDVTLIGTPYDEEEHKIHVMVRGVAPQELSLYRSRSTDAAPAGRFIAEPKTELEYTDTFIHITKARELTAKKDITLRATAFDEIKQILGDESALDIKADAKVFLLKYSGEGSCFVGHDDIVYNMPCPSSDYFLSDNWNGETTPEEFNWWIQTAHKGARGWLRVDGQTVSHEARSLAKKRRKPRKGGKKKPTRDTPVRLYEGR